MSSQSSIEWTDSTWNPVRGCSKVSPGCKNCYAERFAERFRGVPGHPYERGFDIRLVPERLADPLRWSSPRKIFVNSMSDLFHENVPDEYIEVVCEIMSHAQWHIFQVLTKRASRLGLLLSGRLRRYSEMSHIWWGVSVENRKHGLPRLHQLQNTPASTRFLSVEPLLEDLGGLDLYGISWVIGGGESGPGSRPMEPAWVRSIRDQCAEFAIPFFFKQWGGIHKNRNGRVLGGRVHDDFPAVKRAAVLDSKKRKDLIARYSMNELVTITSE